MQMTIGALARAGGRQRRNRALLPAARLAGRHCAEASALAADRLKDVRVRLARLRRIERALAGLVSQCQRSRGRMRCPLIDALSSGAAVHP